MARKKEIVKVPDEWGARDAGKMFLITEWPSLRGETWAYTMFLTISRNGGDLPLSLAELGMQGIAIVGWNTIMRANVDPHVLVPLFNELMDCVKIIRDPKVRDSFGQVIATDIVGDDDIEEITTRGWLKSEVIRVHTGFSAADALSKLNSKIAASSASSTT